MTRSAELALSDEEEDSPAGRINRYCASALEGAADLFVVATDATTELEGLVSALKAGAVESWRTSAAEQALEGLRADMLRASARTSQAIRDAQEEARGLLARPPSSSTRKAVA